MLKNQKGFHHVFLMFITTVVAVIGFTAWRVAHNNKSSNVYDTTTSKILAKKESSEDKAIQAGKNLSANYCSGTGNATFTHLPMNASDFSLLLPYGLVVGGHVTPVDHQYFSPTNFHSARDTYPVYAMADATLTDIQSRYTPNHGTDYRLVFAHSCTFLYYYDLVTSLTPRFKAAFDNKAFNIHVRAGEQVGAIGGQTLDFAVWNTTKPLTGFVDPASYDGEPWKIYTADPFPYYTDDLREVVESKDPRTVAPTAGKIDYDVDGKLIGNWFMQGSGGYHSNSNTAKNYWVGHLSIAPDYLDPTTYIASIGDYDSYPKPANYSDTSTSDGSGARQYMIKSANPEPSKVGISSGMVKYELQQSMYSLPSGQQWSGMSFARGIKVTAQSNQVMATILAQLTNRRTLKFEVFPGKTADQVNGFDSNAKIYTR